MLVLAVAGRAEILDRDWLVAVWAQAPDADGGHERAAVVAALAAERAEAALAAFVDGDVPLAACCGNGQGGSGRGAAAPPGGLLARVRAPAPAAGRGERPPARGTTDRNAIVTRRGCGGWVRAGGHG